LAGTSKRAAEAGRMTTTLYGMHNCDTVRKARKWLDAHDIAYQFHDFRKDGLTEDQVNDWIAELGWQTVINRRSATWRTLDPQVREAMTDSTATAVILGAPTLIKRPLLDTGGERHAGFSGAAYEGIFG